MRPVFLLLLLACRVSFSPALGSAIACGSTTDCPAGFTCDGRISRCHEGLVVARCGDGVVDESEGCDCGDSAQTASLLCSGVNSDTLPDRCRTSCHPAGCGDGVIDGHEECDDGNTNAADGCSATCALEHCGNGRVDPGEACDDGNTAFADGCSADCRSDERCGNGTTDFLLKENCDCGDGSGALPGGCTAPNGVSGGQCNSACLVATCGNGVIDTGEVCDDGNFVAGDGCSAGCLSDETCRNGVVDLAAGEQCDDSNAVNRDGCSSNCQAELAAWHLWQSDMTVGRDHHVMSHDTVRGRVVLFGGSNDSGLLGDHWELVPVAGATGPTGTHAWVRRFSVQMPPARADAAMGYDPLRQRTVLFGGIGASGLLEDTWEFDGSAWSLGGVGPTGSTNAAMAFSPPLGKLVMVKRGQTWAYGASGWTQLVAGTAANTAETSLCTLGNGDILSYGMGDVTREFNGTSWNNVTLGLTPARSGVRIACTTGHNAWATGRNNAYYQYAGGGWTVIPFVQSPQQRDYAGVASAAPSGFALMFGGADNSKARFADLWSYSDATNTATQLYPILSPPSRQGHTASYMPGLGTIMFGGEVSSPIAFADTWLFDGTSWQRLPIAGPSSRFGMTSTYDSARHKIVLFGGRNHLQSTYDDLWELDGNAWTNRALALRPPRRRDAAMAFDSARSVSVLFGGEHAAGVALADTWEYDGNGFIRVQTATAPSARLGHAMAYDPVRGVTVLFGGEPENDETWVYDGAWKQVTVPSPPAARSQHTMSFDASRGRVVMVGGRTAGARRNDAWEFDGAVWHRLNAAFPPDAHEQASLTYDTLRKELVLFGGLAPLSSGITWILAYSGETVEVCGNGKDDDGDAAIDCADVDCADACMPSSESFCRNGADDDGDGQVDCADSDCQGHVCGSRGAVCSAGSCACPGSASESACRDGVDDDCDSLTDCSDPDCSAVCVDARSLVVTEAMINGIVEPTGEWIELYNGGPVPESLLGVWIDDDQRSPITIDKDVLVPAGGYGLIAASGGAAVNGLGSVLFSYSTAGVNGVQLGNGGDEIIVSLGGLLIDRFAYGSTFTLDGRSNQLDFGILSPTGNDNLLDWCITPTGPTTLLPGGTYGTPGAANLVCP